MNALGTEDWLGIGQPSGIPASAQQPATVDGIKRFGDPPGDCITSERLPGVGPYSPIDNGIQSIWVFHMAVMARARPVSTRHAFRPLRQFSRNVLLELSDATPPRPSGSGKPRRVERYGSSAPIAFQQPAKLLPRRRRTKRTEALSDPYNNRIARPNAQRRGLANQGLLRAPSNDSSQRSVKSCHSVWSLLRIKYL